MGGKNNILKFLYVVPTTFFLFGFVMSYVQFFILHLQMIPRREERIRKIWRGLPWWLSGEKFYLRRRSHRRLQV